MKFPLQSTRAWRGWAQKLVLLLTGLVWGLAAGFTPASASPQLSTPLCGAGSPPTYGFNYSQQQAHWTVGWQNYLSESAVTAADVILDQLNADSIAQTMILIQPQAQVGNRVNCAVHFLRYMQLGLATGERQDNGFVFLIVIESEKIDVHYGVGLGLPALTAPELTALNRAAEATYQSTRSLDQALLTLVRGFDTVARNKYAPLVALEPTPEAPALPTLPSGPLGLFAICGLLCAGLIVLPFLLWLLVQMSRLGISFNPTGFGSGGGGFGGGRGGPSSRGGGGSGRSGRGN